MAAAEVARPAAAHPAHAAEALKQHDFAFDVGAYPVEGVLDESSGSYAESDAGASDEGTYVDEDDDRECAGRRSTSTSTEGEEPKKGPRKRRGSKLVGFLRKTTRVLEES